MKYYVIIVAGGKGLRMGKDIPKQFIEVGNLPILMHTMNRFIAYNSSIEMILGLPKEHIEYWNSLCKQYNFNYPHTIVEGGNTRYQTVKNCLNSLINDGVVAIHDGVRPCISIEIIKKCFEIAIKKGSAIPVVPVNDSLRKISGEKNMAVNRIDYRIVQTPQVFQVDIIKNAYKSNENVMYTDDASVVEKAGYMINLVNGDMSNIKITLPSDICLAREIISGMTI